MDPLRAPTVDRCTGTKLYSDRQASTMLEHFPGVFSCEVNELTRAYSDKKLYILSVHNANLTYLSTYIYSKVANLRHVFVAIGYR